MTTGTTSLLSLALPVEGELDGTWGDVVNYGITDYVDIAVAGTLTLTGDGAVTLSNTAGDASGTNIVSSLTGAGTVTAQFAVVKITGTLTTTKVVTVGTSGSPAVSKTYILDNAATGGAVTFKAYGQTGVSVAVGEKCTVYFNGTDFVKVASTVADGVTSVGGTGSVNGITLTGTVTSTGNLTLGGTLTGVSLATQVTGTLPVANGGTGVTTSTGTGSTVLSASPTFTGTPLAPTATTGTNTTQLATTAFVQNQISASAGVTSFSAGTTGLTPSTGTTGAVTLSGTLAVANGGTGTSTPSLLAGSNVVVTGAWPNQTISASGGGGGGTAGILLAAASGALANGDKVVINSDGTVSAISTATDGSGAATAFTSIGSGYPGLSYTYQASSVAFDSTNNKVVISYIAQTSSSIYAVVGTASGTSISFGTPVLIGTTGSIASPISSVFDAASGKVVIIYPSLGPSGVNAIVGTVSGTTISFGTPVAAASVSSTSLSSVYDSANQKIVITYISSIDGYGRSVVGTVSGTSISFGTPVAFTSLAVGGITSAYGGGKVVVFYFDNFTNSYYGTAAVGTVSGTTISFGTPAVYNTARSNFNNATYDSVNNRFVVAYSDVGNSDYGTASVGTVSGTSISFGTKVVYKSSAVGNTGIAISFSKAAGKVVISSLGTSNTGVFYAGTVSGTSISFAAPFTYNSGVAVYAVMGYNSTDKNLIITSSPADIGTYTGNGQVVTVGYSSNLTSTNYIGISDAAYADGTIATIQTVGSTDDAQSGLTAGLAYYVQPNGTLASTAGSPSVFAGTAVSAVKIIIKG